MTELSEEEWLAKGTKLFGEDKLNWRFKCPLCKNVQTAEDFRKHKDKGATPSSVYQECIGRYEGGCRAFGSNAKTAKKSPCDYAAYGLFNIGDIVKKPDGKEVTVFPFAE